MPTILKSRYITEVYDPEKIRKFGKAITRTDNMNIILKSKSFEKDKSLKL